MGITKSEIVFDNHWGTYYPGQTVNGTVLLVFDKPNKVSGISIKFTGEANTSWKDISTRTNTDTDKTEEITNDYEGHEEYFSTQYYLLAKTGDATVLETGAHEYPFVCSLPPVLPSSFEGEYGHIRYTVKVVVERPWRFNQEVKAAFTVVSEVDLNQKSNTKDPYVKDIEKQFCCLCCASAPMMVHISLPCTGYVSGQVIPINIEVDNPSNVSVDKFDIKFKKSVTFHSQMPRETKKTEHDLVHQSTEGVAAGESNRVITHNISIPPLPPSNLTNCSLIELEYGLKITGHVPGCHSNFETNIPITIGTIPFHSGPKSVIPPKQVTEENQKFVNDPLGWNIPLHRHEAAPLLPPSHAQYPSMPMPVYGQGGYRPPTIIGKHDNEYTRNAASDFVPRYPVFMYEPTAPPAPVH